MLTVPQDGTHWQIHFMLAVRACNDLQCCRTVEILSAGQACQTAISATPLVFSACVTLRTATTKLRACTSLCTPPDFFFSCWSVTSLSTFILTDFRLHICFHSKFSDILVVLAPNGGDGYEDEAFLFRMPMTRISPQLLPTHSVSLTDNSDCT